MIKEVKSVDGVTFYVASPGEAYPWQLMTHHLLWQTPQGTTAREIHRILIMSDDKLPHDQRLSPEQYADKAIEIVDALEAALQKRGWMFNAPTLEEAKTMIEQDHVQTGFGRSTGANPLSTGPGDPTP